ncbi:hypothetical protein BTVI_04093 [Pitangus sulphuratus]|nr:hypothetical protein BTVI_04093 [Pitangus sulphuratus]
MEEEKAEILNNFYDSVFDGNLSSHKSGVDGQQDVDWRSKGPALQMNKDQVPLDSTASLGQGNHGGTWTGLRTGPMGISCYLKGRVLVLHLGQGNSWCGLEDEQIESCPAKRDLGVLVDG